MTMTARRDWLFVNCQSGKHKWQFSGCAPCDCSCQPAYGCSIPLYKCEVCGDCDYGDNDEAREIKLECETVPELN